MLSHDALNILLLWYLYQNKSLVYVYTCTWRKILKCPHTCKKSGCHFSLCFKIWRLLEIWKPFSMLLSLQSINQSSFYLFTSWLLQLSDFKILSIQSITYSSPFHVPGPSPKVTERFQLLPPDCGTIYPSLFTVKSSKTHLFFSCIWVPLWL